ncbi:glycosyltransferase [Microbulbifer bruguierae]|uniref:Glycosyltransferase n=1 Tax=Microbulbifer bruguierae TaxID=3029061 RepID=A0ABY8NGZ5_9GAMM|nr:glycosyltransferase [Microbulbifer bruguierae]WGL17720.1 glycosyltransferase [Microbulbifer bruguierae]
MDNLGDFYIYSSRHKKKAPARCCIVELEDVIIDEFNAKLVSAGSEIEQGGILFIATLSVYEVVNALKSLPLSKFSRIYVYVFDAFPDSVEIKRSRWSRELSSSYRIIRKITHMFVPFKHSLDSFRELFQIPVSYVPMAADVVNYGGYDEGKVFDVNGYGRQPKELTSLLSEKFNMRESDRVFLHTNHAGISAIHNLYQHRKLFWKLLRKSRISLLFDSLHTPLDRGFPFSFVPQRMFESIGAGCVVVGKRPTCPEMNELFNWPDSVIELPDDSTEMVDFIEYLLDEYDLESVGRRNYENALALHDWRHRIQDMLGFMER